MLTEQMILRIPGPTPVPPRVQRAMQQPMIGHRDPETSDLLKQVGPGLQQLFGTTQQVSIVAGSGTSGLEAAVINTVAPGEKVIVCVTGAFGERFVSICKSYEIDVVVLEEQWGEAVNADRLKQSLLEHSDVTAVFLTYCETSTGVLNPIEKLSSVVHKYSDALVIVDAVSCLGGVETKLDDWGLDIVVTGSQKALMLPGGLMFVAFSERARAKMEANPRPRFYLDLLKYDKASKEFSTPFTPATSLLFGLQEVVQLLAEETIEGVYDRHRLMREMTRRGLEAMNLNLLATDAVASPTVTAFTVPTVEAKQVRKALKEQFGIRIAAGQGHQKDTVLRIGHMGYCTATDVLTVLTALEIVLMDLGHTFSPGAGTVAAQQVFLKKGTGVHV